MTRARDALLRCNLDCRQGSDHRPTVTGQGDLLIAIHSSRSPRRALQRRRPRSWGQYGASLPARRRRTTVMCPSRLGWECAVPVLVCVVFWHGIPVLAAVWPQGFAAALAGTDLGEMYGSGAPAVSGGFILALVLEGCKLRAARRRPGGT